MFFFFNDTATTEIYTLSLHDALPISSRQPGRQSCRGSDHRRVGFRARRVLGHALSRADLLASGSRRRCRSEEHTSELQSRQYLVCRLLLEKKDFISHAFTTVVRRAQL